MRDVIKAYGLAPCRALSQNFLLDPAICARIAGAAGCLKDKHVIEIGPGPGGLTRALLRAGPKSLIAVEKDPRAVAALADLHAYDSRLMVIQGDALKVDLTTLTPSPRVLMANLPYGIATPLLMAWLHQRGAFVSMVLMFQREVAQRITACPGTSSYGRLSVLAQWLAQVHPVFDLPPGAFWPAPKVHSRVLHITPHSVHTDDPPIEAVERLTAKAFGQRRKMLASTLKDHLWALETLSISPTLRAENLTPQQYVDLARLLGKGCRIGV